MKSLPFYCRVWFAPILTGTSAGIATLCFLATSLFYPVEEIDFGFYVGLYSAIGAATGFAAWYFARLVARRRVAFVSLALAAFPAYLFVLLLALDKNPFVALLATFAFGFILSLPFFARPPEKELA